MRLFGQAFQNLLGVGGRLDAMQRLRQGTFRILGGFNVGVSLNRGTQCRPQNTIVLIIGDPNGYPTFWETPVYDREGRTLS